MRKPRTTVVAFACLLVALAPAAAHAQSQGPLRTRNLSPLISIFGVPAWEVAGAGRQLGVSADVANHFRLSTAGGETLVLDGETWRESVYFRRRLARGWSLGVELPYFQQSGGFLDDVIDAWHSAFRLPDGGRNARAEDQLLFVLGRDSSRFLLLNRRSSGLGDVQLGIGREFGARGSLLLRGTLKLPTGDAATLAGSGAADVAVTLSSTRSGTLRGRPASFYWGAGVVGVGEPSLVRFAARKAAAVGMVGASWQALPRFGVKAQLDLHSPFYISELEELSDPGVQATLGGWWQWSARTVFELGVNEDLSVSTSPDVVIHMGVKWTR